MDGGSCKQQHTAKKRKTDLDAVEVVGVEVEAVPGGVEPAPLLLLLVHCLHVAPPLVMVVIRLHNGGEGGVGRGRAGRAADASGAGGEDEVLHHGHAPEGRVRRRRCSSPGRRGGGGAPAPRAPERRRGLLPPHARSSTRWMDGGKLRRRRWIRWVGRRTECKEIDGLGGREADHTAEFETGEWVVKLGKGDAGKTGTVFF
jgi:hypothetical protein